MPCTLPKVKSNYVTDWKEASLISSHYQSIFVFTILGSVSLNRQENTFRAH